MADNKKSKPTHDEPAQKPAADLPQGGLEVAPAGGGAVPVTVPEDFAARLPSGGFMLSALEEDVAEDVGAKLEEAAPAFGNVLSAIGNAVAESQKALDKSVVDTINKLNDTTIDVVNQVVIELNDDGVPYGDEAHTTLVKNTVSVLNYYTPVFHAWREVRIAMDLAVGAFHTQQGFQFSQKQSSTSIGGGISWAGAFGGWFSASHSRSQQSAESSSQSDVAWSSGQLLVDAEIGPRATVDFPPAAEIAIGPQILILQGKIEELKSGTTVTGRSVDLAIEIRKSNGEPNPEVAFTVEAPGLSGGGNKATDKQGKATVQLTRDLSAGTRGFRQFPLSVRLGAMSKPYPLTL